MTIAKLTAALIGLLLLATPAVASAPSIYSIHKDTQLPLAQCVARARAVVAQNGFTNIQSATYSTFGFTADYSIVLRCMPDQKLLFIVVAGPQLSESDRLANKALDEF